jgi:hypothetical protein
MVYWIPLNTNVYQRILRVKKKMPKPRRELKNIAVTAKVTSTTSKKIIAKCEDEGISVSEYIGRLINKDLKIK